MDNKKFVEAKAQAIFTPNDAKGFSFGEGSNEAFNSLKKVMEELDVSDEPIKIIGGAISKESGTPVIDIKISVMLFDHSTNPEMLTEAAKHVIQRELKNIARYTALGQTILGRKNNEEQDKKECSK